MSTPLQRPGPTPLRVEDPRWAEESSCRHVQERAWKGNFSLILGHELPRSRTWDPPRAASHFMYADIEHLSCPPVEKAVYTTAYLAQELAQSETARSQPARAEIETRVAALEAENTNLHRRIAALESRYSSPSDDAPDGPDLMILVGRWIDENRLTYKGRWVALKDGVLQGVGDTLPALKDDLKERGLTLGGMFVTKVP